MKQFGVKREDLARALAERRLVTREEAQDALDRVVHDVIKTLRRGGAAEMPGVGQLTAQSPGAGRPASKSGMRGRSRKA